MIRKQGPFESWPAHSGYLNYITDPGVICEPSFDPRAYPSAPASI